MADGGNLIFARVVRFIAEEMAAETGDRDPDEPGEAETGLADPDAAIDDLAATLNEIATAFEQAGGFHFEADQALTLTHLFSVLEAGMRALSEQAAGQGQHNAAAKIEWAAGQAREMAAYLMEKHGSGDGGTLVVLEHETDD